MLLQNITTATGTICQTRVFVVFLVYEFLILTMSACITSLLFCVSATTPRCPTPRSQGATVAHLPGASISSGAIAARRKQIVELSHHCLIDVTAKTKYSTTCMLR